MPRARFLLPVFPESLRNEEVQNFLHTLQCWERSDPKALLHGKGDFWDLNPRKCSLTQNPVRGMGVREMGRDYSFILWILGIFSWDNSSGINHDSHEEFQAVPDILWC